MPTPRVAVAAPDAYGVEAALQVAGAGGNAVDAAIAAIITCTVTQPGVVSPMSGAFINVWGRDDDPVVGRAPEQSIGSQTTFDVAASRDLSADVTVSLGVVNLIDRDPPLAQFALGYDPVVADPRGRVVTMGVSRRF